MHEEHIFNLIDITLLSKVGIRKNGKYLRMQKLAITMLLVAHKLNES